MSALAPLEALYEHVVSLAEWARQWPDVSPLLETFEQSVYVTWNGHAPALPRVAIQGSLQDVVESAHRANIQSMKAVHDGWKRRNIFSIGRFVRHSQLVVEQRNPTTAALSQSRDWKRIFDAIGPSRFLLLLTEYSVFYGLENSCFHQLAGVGAQNVPARPQQIASKKRPVDIRFSLSAISYKQRDVRHFGWPSDHLFCPRREDPLSAEAKTTALLRAMFPRSYGEKSVFNQEVPSSAREPPPKTLQKTVGPMAEELLGRATQLKVKDELFRMCPSQLPSHTLDEEEEQAIYHLVTQEPYALQATQAATQAADRFFIKRDQAKRDHLPCFLDFSCPHYVVVRFVQQVVRVIVSPDWFGSVANLTHVMDFIGLLIRAKRHDVISLQALVEGFCSSDCRWLFPLGRDGKPARLAQNDALRRIDMLHDFLHWLIEELVMPLLSFNFFITESTATRNQLHYFRCDNWAALCRPVLDKLKQRLYEPAPAGVDFEDALGTSVVRMLPKERGMRPIANLGHRKPIPDSTKREASINDKLSDTRVALTFENKKRPELLGASIFTPNDIVKPLIKLKERLRPVLGKTPVYFVKVDVRACFDTIRQERLLAVMQDLIDPEATYVLSKHAELTLRHGFVFRQFGAKSVLDQDEEALFTDNVLKLASANRRRIYIDTGTTVTLQADELMVMLTKLIRETYIRFGEDIFRQKEGIPQGSCISGILCSLFYAHLDRHVLGDLRAARDNLLVRLLDDFLFVSTRESDAEQFLNALLQRSAPYGIEIAKEKSVVNFELPSQSIYEGIRQIPLEDDFSWCGFALDQRLELRIDYKRQENDHMRDTFAASSGRNPGKHFFARFYTAARSPMLRAALDPKLNSLRTIRISIYQAFMSMAMRMYAYSTAHLSTKRGVVLFNRHRLLILAAERVITSRKGGLCFPNKIKPKQIIFLGLTAFERVWARKGREGQKLIAELRAVVRMKAYERQWWRQRSQAALQAPSNGNFDVIRF